MAFNTKIRAATVPKNAVCRSCKSKKLFAILSLGDLPLANSLLSRGDDYHKERYFPLDLVLCTDCSLVQITETVDPEILFGEYLYFSSFSETMLAHALAIVERSIESQKLGAQSLAIEIASNDGYLLKHYIDRGVPVLGIEPAKNIAQVANDKGIKTINDFFGKACAQRLADEGIFADIIHANNVLAHVAELNGVIAGLKLILKPGGRIVCESPYIRDMIDHLEFDTIYHEHLCYYSLTALINLFHMHNLEIVDVERLSIHGGTMRIFVAHKGCSSPSINVVELLHEEKKWGVCEPRGYSDFARRVESLQVDLLNVLNGLKVQGKRIAAYGASAKGSTLMNTFGIDQKILEFVVDRSTVKQGRITPGNHLEIHAPAALIENKIDYALLLTWNFSEEILRQQADFRAKGGKFILPLPIPKII